MSFLGIFIPVLIEIVFPLFLIYKFYRNYNAIKYYAKFTLLFAGVSIVPILLLPLFLVRPKNVLNLLPCAAILKNISRVSGLKFTLRGDKYLRSERTCVIVSNHQSCLDLLGMFEIWSVIARMLLLFTGPFGIGSYLCGLIFINKSSADRGKQKMNDAMEKLKREKTKLWVFPEGYRNHSGSIDEFKKGAFHMAIQAQVPIVPIVFTSYRSFMIKKEKVFNSGEVIIEALPEISTIGLTSDDVNRLTEETREAMIKKYNELNLEIENRNKKE